MGFGLGCGLRAAGSTARSFASLSALLCYFGGCLGTACTPHQPAAAAPHPAVFSLPGLALNDLDGKPVFLQELVKGRVSVIDLWASWCEACKAEHEALDRLQKAYGAQGLLIVAVNQGEDPEYVRRYAWSQNYSYPVLLDPDFKLAEALGETGLPVLMVIDRAGRIAHRTNHLDYKTLATVKEELGRTGGESP